MLEQRGLETEWFPLPAGPVEGCRGCGGCRENHRCVIQEDGGNDLIEAILRADGVAVASPVYFGGPNGALCALLDRVFFAASTHGQLFRGKPAVALVSCDYVGGAAALDRLCRYFTVSQMPVAACQDFPVFPHHSVIEREERALAILNVLGENLAGLVLGSGQGRSGSDEM